MLKIKFPEIYNLPLVSSLLLFIAGICIEIIQPFFDRGFSLKDISVNFLGILISYFYLSDHKNKFKLLIYTSIFSVVAVSIPIYNSYLLYQYRLSSFPILFDPSNDLFELAQSSYESKLSFNEPDCGMKVSPSEIEFSGVRIDLGFSNWKKFKYLMINLTNPNDTILELALRIDDSGKSEEFDSRYNDKIQIQAHQEINLLVPLTQIERKVTARKFNLESLDQALLFPANSANPFCIGKIELK